MSEHIFIVIILLQTSYLLNNTLQYNSSQNYFLQATTWDRPFKKAPISFSLHNLKIIHMADIQLYVGILLQDRRDLKST